MDGYHTRNGYNVSKGDHHIRDSDHHKEWWPSQGMVTIIGMVNILGIVVILRIFTILQDGYFPKGL